MHAFNTPTPSSPCAVSYIFSTLIPFLLAAHAIVGFVEIPVLLLFNVPYVAILLHSLWSFIRRQPPPVQDLPPPHPKSIFQRCIFWLSSQALGFYLNLYRLCLVYAQVAGFLAVPTIAMDVAMNFRLDLAQKAMYGLIEPYNIKAALVLTLLGELPAYLLYYSCMNVSNLFVSAFGLSAVFLGTQAAASMYLFAQPTTLVPNSLSMENQMNGDASSHIHMMN